MRKWIAGALCLVLLLPVVPASGAENPAFGTLWDHFSAWETDLLSGTQVYSQPPQYFQTDYPNTPYGHGTVSTSGCGIVCLAMAASYLKDRTVTPDQLAEQFGSLQMNNVERIDHAIDVLELPFAYKPRNFRQMLYALSNGQMVILLLSGTNDFVDGQHMILLTGLTDNGRVTVLDPFEPNYNRVDMITGYVHGFPAEVLEDSFDGGWIFGPKRAGDGPDYLASYQNYRSMDWFS